MDGGEEVSAALKREFGEEALNSIEATEEEKEKIKEDLKKYFAMGTEMYRGEFPAVIKLQIIDRFMFE